MALNFIRYAIKSAEIMLKITWAQTSSLYLLSEYCWVAAKTVQALRCFRIVRQYTNLCHNFLCITSTEDIALSSKHKMDLRWIRFEHSKVQKCIKYGKSAVCWEQHCDKQVIHSCASAILKGFSHSLPHFRADIMFKNRTVHPNT